jgi:hypothetical protein
MWGGALRKRSGNHGKARCLPECSHVNPAGSGWAATVDGVRRRRGGFQQPLQFGHIGAAIRAGAQAGADAGTFVRPGEGGAAGWQEMGSRVGGMTWPIGSGRAARGGLGWWRGRRPPARPTALGWCVSARGASRPTKRGTSVPAASGRCPVGVLGGGRAAMSRPAARTTARDVMQRADVVPHRRVVQRALPVACAAQGALCGWRCAFRKRSLVDETRGGIVDVFVRGGRHLAQPSGVNQAA